VPMWWIRIHPFVLNLHSYHKDGVDGEPGEAWLWASVLRNLLAASSSL
jgi:hypothetical protein